MDKHPSDRPNSPAASNGECRIWWTKRWIQRPNPGSGSRSLLWDWQHDLRLNARLVDLESCPDLGCGFRCRERYCRGACARDSAGRGRSCTSARTRKRSAQCSASPDARDRQAEHAADRLDLVGRTDRPEGSARSACRKFATRSSSSSAAHSDAKPRAPRTSQLSAATACAYRSGASRSAAATAASATDGRASSRAAVVQSPAPPASTTSTE